MHIIVLREVGRALLLLCGLSVIVLVGVHFVGAVYKGATYKCRVEGPRLTGEQIERVLEPGEPLEALAPTGSFTLLPMGRACDYELADGSGTLRVTDGDWGYTAFVGSLALGAVAGGVMLALSRERRSAPRA